MQLSQRVLIPATAAPAKRGERPLPTVRVPAAPKELGKLNHPSGKRAGAGLSPRPNTYRWPQPHPSPALPLGDNTHRGLRASTRAENAMKAVLPFPPPSPCKSPSALALALHVQSKVTFVLQTAFLKQAPLVQAPRSVTPSPSASRCSSLLGFLPRIRGSGVSGRKGVAVRS